MEKIIIMIVDKKTNNILRYRDVTERSLQDIEILMEGVYIALPKSQTVVLKRFII